MELIYLYPKLDNAPARVGKSILKELVKHIDDLPFDNIKLFLINKKLYITECEYKFETISFSELVHYPKKYVVHIPISPSVMPNKKFLLNLFCLIKRKPLILQYHGDVRNHVITRLKYRKTLDMLSIPSFLFMPILLKTATRVITPSYLLENIIKNYGVKNSIVVPNGIDEHWLEPLKNNNLSGFESIVDKNNFNIFYHGTLSPEKGVEMLIEAVGRYAKINPNTMLYIAGDGPQRKYLQELCLKLNINGNVVFLNFVDRETIKFFLKNVDVAIYPSRFDAFCLAVLEALACADCPVYFSKNAGIYDFAVQEGYKLNYFKPTTENIFNILNLEHSEYDKNVMFLQKEFASKYTWDNIIKYYIDLYWDVVSDELGVVIR